MAGLFSAILRKVGFLSKSEENEGGVPNLHPVIIPRNQHSISRKGISEEALKVLYRLHHNGYAAYLVGGGVRDLLLGRHPKDFDVVTDAKPEEIKSLFKNCRLIGRRFRLAHIYFGQDIVEVATFRAHHDRHGELDAATDEGMVVRDNIYGSLEEDAWRRDFTVNALYYNIADFSLVDYTGGVQDLLDKRLRMIGEPQERFREDPIRILRAVRLSCKLGLSLDPSLISPMKDCQGFLQNVAPARLFEEMVKLFHCGAAQAAFLVLKESHIFDSLFEQTAGIVRSKEYPQDALLDLVLSNTDLRVQSDMHVTPAFILASLLWYPMLTLSSQYIENGLPLFPARLKASGEVFRLQSKTISIPKRLVLAVEEIWTLQLRLMRRDHKRARQLVTEPRFRAAYDFLLLRAQVEKNLQETASFWKKIVEGDESAKKSSPSKSRKFRSKKHAKPHAI